MKMTIAQAEKHTIHKVAAGVITEAYRRLGIETEFVFVPSKRSLIMVNSGRTDAEVGRIPAIVSKFENLMIVGGTPIATVKGIVLTISSDCVCKTWDDLKNYRIGIRRGEAYAEKGTAQMDVVVTSSYSQLFNMLRENRIDVAVGILTSAQIALQSDFKDSGIKIIGAELINVPLHHVLNIKHAALEPRLREVLKQMAKSGEIQIIHDQVIKDIVASSNPEG